jgi:hypothetical protein
MKPVVTFKYLVIGITCDLQVLIDEAFVERKFEGGVKVVRCEM